MRSLFPEEPPWKRFVIATIIGGGLMAWAWYWAKGSFVIPRDAVITFACPFSATLLGGWSGDALRRKYGAPLSRKSGTSVILTFGIIVFLGVEPILSAMGLQEPLLTNIASSIWWYGFQSICSIIRQPKHDAA